MISVTQHRSCDPNLINLFKTQCFLYVPAGLQFRNSTFCPQSDIYVFCVDLRTNSDYFTVQHWLTGFYNWEGVCLLRGTFYILRSAHTVYLCVFCGSENKQRLFHCTALTDWFFITETECVLLHDTFYILRSAHRVHLCVSNGSQNKRNVFTAWYKLNI
jgi:hypothetical protein